MLLNLLWMESRVHPFKTQAVTLHLEIVIQKRTVIAMNALIFRSVQISNVGEICFTFDNFEINCSFTSTNNSGSFGAINPFLPTYLGYKSFVKAKSLLLHHINRCSIFYHSIWRASFLPYFNFFSKYGCRFGCMLIYFGFSCPNSFDSLSWFLQCL